MQTKQHLAFFVNRQHLSPVVELQVGVPQGFVLGPLFAVYSGSDLPGGGFNPPNDFLTPRVSVDLSSWGVDSNPIVSVTC